MLEEFQAAANMPIQTRLRSILLSVRFSVALMFRWCRPGRHCSGVMHRALQTDSISVVEHSPLLRRSSNLSHKGQVTFGAKRRPSPKNCAISQIMQQRA